MAKSEKSITNAATLLAERRKYEAWLAALDQRRATTPERVFARVRADYAARLEAVVANLASNADAIDTQVRELNDRLKSLQAEVQAVEDERAEAELRAHVGELEQEAWETSSREAEARIASLGDERRKVEAELASLRELLTAARTPTPSAASLAIEPPAAKAGSVADSGADAPAATPVAEPAAGADATEQGGGGSAPSVAGDPSDAGDAGHFDELAFLRDVTGVTPAQPLAPAADAGSPPAAAPPERPINDALGLVLPSDAPAITAPRRASTEAPLGTAPTVTKPEVGRQGKTLKCTDCGSLNYPTEWYCERCGAELSAL